MTPRLAEASDGAGGTGADAAKAAREAMARVLRERLALVQALDVDLAALIESALARITAQLAAAPSDYQLWVLPRLMEGINRVLDELATNAAARAGLALGKTWALGERLVADPIAAAPEAPPAAQKVQPTAATSAVPGSNVVPVDTTPTAGMGTPQLRQLQAMQQFTTSMIKGATGDTVKAINRALGQVVLGVSQPFEAIQIVAKLLPDRTRSQIRGIVNTNLATAFNSAAHSKLLQQAALDPNLRKQWRRSGKKHSRPNHDAADGQVVPVAEPFVLLPGSPKGELVRLMYPCDPAAPVGEVIHCGCVALPWKATWKMRNPGSTLKAPTPAPAVVKPSLTPGGKTAPKAAASKAAGSGMTTAARIQGAFAAGGGTWRDVTGQRLVVDERLAPASIGDARLTKPGTDLYSYHAVQTIKRPSEVWQTERVDMATAEIVRSRIFLKRFTAGGQTWLGRAEFRAEGERWVPAGPYRADLVGAAIDAELTKARAGVRVWPKRK